MPKKNPFRLRLHKLTNPTPRRIYRFRHQVKRLRAYLLLYVFPKEPPPLPPIDMLYKKAGKLRQAYLIRKATKDFSPSIFEKARKQVKKEKKRFLKAYWALRPEAKKFLKVWAKRFPLPEGAARRQWYLQGQACIARWKALLKDFPPPPYTPEGWHALRILLRCWEMAAYWVELPELPPPGLTDYLGQTRDSYLLHKWLTKNGASAPLLNKVWRRYCEYEQKALEAWENWRPSLF